MDGYFSTQEYEAERHPLATDVKVKWQFAIDRAVSMIKLQTPTILDRADQNTDLKTVLRGVVFDMVERSAPGQEQGAQARTAESENVGPFSRSVTYAAPTDNLYVLDKELALLRPTTSRRKRAGSVYTPPRP